MQLKPGMRLRSVVCTSEVVVVRAPATAVDLACGGAPMILARDDRPAGHALAAHALRCDVFTCVTGLRTILANRRPKGRPSSPRALPLRGVRAA